MSLRSALGLALALAAGAWAFAPSARALNDEGLGFEITPPRLSFADGTVSFLRAGGDDWSPARVNTPLAAGDELFSAGASNLELQIGPRAYVRGGEQTQLGLTSLEPDFLQFRLTSGHLSLDLRSLKSGQTIEVDTPHAAFTVERSGYYRVEVAPDTTSFTSRRGGQAQVTPASGATAVIAASEQLVVRGDETAQVETFAAPELDAWDRWNYARTDDQLDAVSARYVSSEVYGAEDLDQYGDWRVVPSYGALWVPRHVAPGWAPYSSGVWLSDPYYGWSWVDDAPWGWAPYHYGRWVNVSGYWGWYPGPIVARAYYAPALVAFYGGPVAVGLGPSIGWVALGYGEPLYPWWGPTYFRGRPCWTGWNGGHDSHWDHHDDHHGGHGGHNDNHGGHGDGHGGWDGGHDGHDGDHDNFHRYKNAGVKDAVVAVDRDHFGRRNGPDAGMQYWRARADQKLQPLDRDLDVAPDASSRVAARGQTERPARDVRERSVVATRAPRGERGISERSESQRVELASVGAPRRRRATRRSPTRATRARTRCRRAWSSRSATRAQRGTATRPPFGQSDEVRKIPPPAAALRAQAGARTTAATTAPRRDATATSRPRARTSAASPTTPRGRRAIPSRRRTTTHARGCGAMRRRLLRVRRTRRPSSSRRIAVTSRRRATAASACASRPTGRAAPARGGACAAPRRSGARQRARAARRAGESRLSQPGREPRRLAVERSRQPLGRAAAPRRAARGRARACAAARGRGRAARQLAAKRPRLERRWRLEPSRQQPRRRQSGQPFERRERRRRRSRRLAGRWRLAGRRPRRSLTLSASSRSPRPRSAAGRCACLRASGASRRTSATAPSARG